MLDIIQMLAWSGVVYLVYRRCVALDPKSRMITVWSTAGLGAMAAAHVLAPFLWPSMVTVEDATTAVAVFAFLVAIHGVRRVSSVHREDAIRP